MLSFLWFGCLHGNRIVRKDFGCNWSGCLYVVVIPRARNLVMCHEHAAFEPPPADQDDEKDNGLDGGNVRTHIRYMVLLHRLPSSSPKIL